MTGKLQIAGEVYSDEASLKAYSVDMSHYSVKPRIVAVPANEDDLGKIIAYAKQESTPITPRGAGSNQSGSAVGAGIIVLFSKMNATIKKEGRRVRVQSGAIHQALDQQLAADGLRIPYDPTSRGFCTIGGNVATKASGLRSLKYGTADSALRSLRFFDAAHGLIDTSKGLPENLEEAIVELKKRLTQRQRSDGHLKSARQPQIQQRLQPEKPHTVRRTKRNRHPSYGGFGWYVGGFQRSRVGGSSHPQKAAVYTSSFSVPLTEAAPKKSQNWWLSNPQPSNSWTLTALICSEKQTKSTFPLTAKRFCSWNSTLT